MKHLTLTFLVLLSFTAWCFGQETEEEHPIDIAWKHCHSLDSNWTTYGMTGCELAASEKWDNELNRYYKLLSKLMTEEQLELLKASQRQWIMFRDKELDFSSKMYYDMQGTMWGTVSASRQRSLNRTRTLELKSYYDNLTMGREE